MTGAPEGSPKVVLCGFMEKPGIEPATPGLQGIALIHYTTGSLLKLRLIYLRINIGHYKISDQFINITRISNLHIYLAISK